MRAQPVRWKIARRHLNPPRTPHRLRWIVAIFFSFILLLSSIGAAAAMIFVSQLPPVSRFHIHYAFQDARIYDSAGALLYNMADLQKNGGQRIVEPLQGLHDQGNACRGGVNRIPLILQTATIATEDATFYKNPGFDIMSIARAAYQDWSSGHIVSGASTITQQLVRANMLSDVRTYTRKAQEVALAYEISKRFSKRKILWYYLNSVAYGNLAYGAQAAAKVYFYERVCRLDLAQAAFLAGLPRSPSDYDPVLHRAAALARMYTVLDLMRKHGYIHSRAVIAAALQEARGWTFHAPKAPMRYPHFVRYVISQMKQMPALRNQLYQGIDVYTTLDPRLQDLAQSLVAKQIDGLTAQHVTDGALVSLDLRLAHYGWILAMVGSAHYSAPGGQVNMAIEPRQPGSSMKPFNYIWAFAHGDVGPGTLVTDSPISLPDPGNADDGGWYSPIDYDHSWHGTVPVRLALANSLNVPAVKTEYYVTGIAHVAQTAYSFGETHLYSDNPHLDCSVCWAMTLGGLSQGVRPLEHTAAYGVFATDGWTVPPVAIWKVVKRSTGRVIYCSEDCPRGVQPDPQLATSVHRVLDASHAYEMTSILSDNSARCAVQVCEFGLNSPLLLDRPAAAKTGTTNSWTDNWTVGYTPQIVTGVWVGNADRSAMVNVNGITGAAPVWHDFMEGAFRILRLPVMGFVQPPGVVLTNRCSPVPGSRSFNIGSNDIFVPGPRVPLYPRCAIGDQGYMPFPCFQYQYLPNSPTPQCVIGSQYPANQPGTQLPSSPLAPQPPAQQPLQPPVQPPLQPPPVQSPLQPAPIQPVPQPAPVQPAPLQPP